MKFLKRILGNSLKQKDKEVSIERFWNWFEKNQARFHQVINSGKQVEQSFINPVFGKLQALNAGAYLVAGMKDSTRAEIVFTAEGDIKVYPFITELVTNAPSYDNWLFTAFKPPLDIDSSEIRMGEVRFSSENISFYAVTKEDYPDEISIKLVYQGEHNTDDPSLIENGCFIFLENWLGEINTVTKVDVLGFDRNGRVGHELIPISKLKDYINWREKEFLEKYEGTYYDTENSTYAIAEWVSDGISYLGKCNRDLIEWDAKASHPWMFAVELQYDPHENNGFPTSEMMQEIHGFEEFLSTVFVDKEGCLEIAQITGNGERKMFYACKTYSEPIVKLETALSSAKLNASFVVYKDKYWRSVGVFENIQE